MQHWEIETKDSATSEERKIDMSLSNENCSKTEVCDDVMNIKQEDSDGNCHA